MRSVLLFILALCVVPAMSNARQSSASIWPEYFGTGHARCSGRSLVSQGFSGAMMHTTTIKYVGKISSAGLYYFIYYYYFINPASGHGHDRVLVLRPNCRYIGSYILDDGPSGASGEVVRFPFPREVGNVIRFRNGRPPKNIWIDQSNSYLEK